MYQALYRKYRPRTFDDVVGQGHITQTLKRQVETGRLSHAYLFTGTRGTGKTTCAKILARAVNCRAPENGSPCNRCDACLGIENGSVLDVLELDAASNNRVDDIRAILDEAVYTPASVKKRVYIIDEVHMLSAQAFNALLQILEEPPAHLMFILATTEIHKVPATIKSRCQQFAFRRIRAEEIAARLLYVAGQEGVELTPEGAALIARLADGGMRDALSLLDQCMGQGGSVDEARVYAALGLAGSLETAALMESVADGDTAAALARLEQLYAGGREMAALVGEMAGLVRDLLVRKTAPRGGSGLLTGNFDETVLHRLSGRFDVPRLVQMLRQLQGTGADLARSPNRRTDVELCLVTLCDPSLDPSPAGLCLRVSRLEQGLGAAGTLSPAQNARREAAPAGQQGGAPSRPSRSAPAEDTPPWTEEPPPERGSDTSVPQEQTPARTEARPSETEPAQQASASVPEAPGTQPAQQSGAGELDWGALRDALRGDLGVADYSFLANPAMVEGRVQGDTLTLWACNEFIRDMVGKREILGKIAARAQAMTGRAVRVEAKAGQPPQAEKGAAQSAAQPDALEEFLAGGLDNLIVE